MSAEVLDMVAARAEKSARLRAWIEQECEHRGTVLAEWLFEVTPQRRGDIAEYLASEIITRYRPIAQQFRALYDVVELYVAAAHERGEDLNHAVLLALTVMMGDERYIGIAKHIVREQAIEAAKLDPLVALEIRRKSPSPVDEACSALFSHYSGLRRK